MTTDEKLTIVADRYRKLGFKVVLHPGADDLPEFAKDFKVEMVARKDGDSILLAAKKNTTELQADPNLARYVEITNREPGWRFDVFVMGPDIESTQNIPVAGELSDDDLRHTLDEVERLRQAGFVAQSLVAAWAVLEAVMRRRLRAGGEEAGWGTSPRTMLNELYSSGDLSSSVFRDLEGLLQLRNKVAHGFTPGEVYPTAPQFVLDTARKLLKQPLPEKQSA